MKRLAIFVASLVAGLVALRAWRTRKADAELWEEATRDLG
jgi:hypothetical protein